MSEIAQAVHAESQRTHLTGDRVDLLSVRIIYENSTALHTVKELRGVHAQGTDIPIIQDTLPFVLGSKAVRSIVNHLEIMALCDGFDRLHITRHAENMRCENGRGFGRYRGLDQCWIYIEGLRIYVDKHRGGLLPDNARGSSNVGKRGSDDFTGGLHSAQRDLQGDGSIPDHGTVVHA
ncbi:MAG: Uncharacterised protein [Cryomorphaceae bacterium]|nr:MAG: Uncharacterised protein [Cryomorphaceae bacterium]